MNRCFFSLTSLFLVFVGSSPAAGDPTPEQIEFFESRIRPIFAQECYECHSEATKAKGGLLLDTRAGWSKGGDSGEPVIVPGDPSASLLLQSIRHEVEDLEMPKAGAKLEEIVISDFEKWIKMGAPDPRDAPPSPEILSKDTNWEAVRERRKGWWSFQPIQDPAVPDVAGTTHPVDAFVRKRLHEEGWASSPQAEPRILHRRIAYTLTGLPPTMEESQQFLKEWETDPDAALSRLVEIQLASPAFGEKWARHWMDWIRYADTHGSEGDPTIPHAWQYRDYLIRSLNSDVPYKQLVIEHLAGDLLDDPRINEELQISESAIGPAHLRMVFHGFAPTDALDERVRFTDDQVNAVTKAFLGLTVSCARCHDHKFDAISQADFYALFGIFTAPLPATVAIDAPGVLTRHRDRLAELKEEIRTGLAEEWLRKVDDGGIQGKVGKQGSKENPLLRLLVEMEKAKQPGKTWQSTAKAVRAAQDVQAGWQKSDEVRYHWDFADAESGSQWTRIGEGLSGEKPSPAGSFSISPEGDVVQGVFPAGIYSHLISTKHRGFLATPPIDLDGEYDLHVQMIGEGASGRYAVQHYPRNGTVYPVTKLEKGEWQWTGYKRLDYWSGDQIHLEFATAGEAPILVSGKDRSWFGVREAWLVKKGSPVPTVGEKENLAVLFEDLRGIEVNTTDGAKDQIAASLIVILRKWSAPDGELTDEEALFLNDTVQAGFLPNSPNELPDSIREKVEEYRKLEQEIPTPKRAPGLIEHSRHEQPLYDRGDHKKPLQIVPARFLEAIDETPYATNQSGRLELAKDMFRDDNPFTARVIVNRVWHHLFGNGLVATMDNFGRLGEAPSHPELLDFLASRFRDEHKWSMKNLVRDLVLTETFLQASETSDATSSLDPENRLLSHFTTRRLEAEAIRDSILAVAGTLDETRYGPAVSGNSPRRSVYLRVKRNDLDPLLTTFDFPVPATTVGKRSSTNVPAQSLTLLNDRFIINQAGRWADRVLAATSDDANSEVKIGPFFEMALGRPPSETELEKAKTFLETVEKEKAAVEDLERTYSEELITLQEKRRNLIDPIRVALWKEKSEQLDAGAEWELVAAPRFYWDFAQATPGDKNEIGHQFFGSATVKQGSLVLDGKGFLATDPLPIDVGEKSFFARVQLTTDQQRGGGVISLQDLQGGLFDSLVYAELKPGEWLAGSNNHKRTFSFEAKPDPEALERAVSIVVTYEEDGTIRCYRDGLPWGKPIRKAPLSAFKKGESQILLGLRHGRAAGSGDQGGRNLSGRIYEAGLYDRVLSPEEIRSLSKGGAVFVAPEEIDEALTEAQINERNRLDEEISRIEQLLTDHSQKAGAFSGKSGAWHDLAHAIFNLKEFIYLR